MATWIAHIRLAENLLEYGFELDVQSFLVGNIAPDAGLPIDGGYEPHKNITHWRDMNENIQPEDFYAEYLDGKTYDAPEYAFLLGYYVHLVTDSEWTSNVWQANRQTNPVWQALFETGEKIERTLKNDWYGLDFCYLHAHPTSLFYSRFQQIEAVPDYLGIFPAGAFSKSVERIKAYYADEGRMQEALSHDYRYLTESDMLTWLDCTTVTLMELLKGKGVACPNPKPLFADRYLHPAI